MRRQLFLIILLLLIAPTVNALECDEKEKQQKISIANNIEFNYEHNGNGWFSIEVNNMPDDMFLIDDEKKENINNGNKDKLMTEYYGGLTYSFRIFSSTGTCKNIRLLTKNIDLPKYNHFSELEYCQENPAFEYCDPWYSGHLTIEEFNSAMEKTIDEELETKILGKTF